MNTIKAIVFVAIVAWAGCVDWWRGLIAAITLGLAWYNSTRP